MSKWIDFSEFKERFLKVPVEEYPNEVLEAVPEPKVSVLLVTYNHVNYIREAIDSVLMQETDFQTEIIIGDDDSNDGTREICIEYAKKYPKRIRLFLHSRANNIKVLGKPCLIFQYAYNLFQLRGEYIALLSGDDYWTDSQKLSKQVTFLNKRVDISLCFHEWIKKNEDSGQYLNNEIPAQSYPMPATWMFRNHFKKLPLHFFNVLQEDDFQRFILKTKGGESFLYTIKPTVYRVHSQNIWQSLDREFKYKSHIHTTKQILKTFRGTTFELELKIRLKKQIIKRHRIIQAKNKKRLDVFSLIREMQDEQLLTLFLKDFLKRAVVKFCKIIRINNLINIGKYWRTLYKFGFKELNLARTENSILLKNVITNPYSGIVFINEKEILLNSIFNKRKWRSLHKFANSKFNKDLPSATIIEHGPWNNYYHWHIDCVPRLWGLWRNPESAPDNLTLLMSRNLSEEEEAIIKALLPSGIKINHVSKEDVFKVGHFLFLPFLSGNCSGKLPGEYLDFFISRMEGLFQLKKDKPKKIFISRRHSSKRRFTNQTEVEAFMETNGFHNLVLENMSIAEQASWFYNAEMVVGLHGAGFTNLLYSRNAKVVEIFPFQNSHLNHYRDLCLAKGLPYQSFFLNGKSKNEDVYCPLSLAQRVVAEF